MVDQTKEIGETERLSVAQMSEVTGVSSHTLRYYERAGLISRIPRTSGNQRRYRTSDVEWVRFLQRLRATGMRIAQMREYATLRATGDATVGQRLEFLNEHHSALREHIATLHSHERELRRKIEIYQELKATNERDQHGSE